ncbi:MAG: hypothetical protein HN919_02530 [Verrucomicrobia bacterium]|jgi:hypothetical protein|nr:hypothetical protein [Verrucomicrobiota bacterium]
MKPSSRTLVPRADDGKRLQAADMNNDHYIFIHSSEPLDCGLDELEDELFAVVECRGDVTGTGTGPNGWNVDIEFESPNSLNGILIETARSLKRHGLGEGTNYNVCGRQRSLPQILDQFGIQP